MQRILYFDLRHGISGDMLLASLLGCFEEPAALAKDLEAIHLSERFSIKMTEVMRSEIHTCHVEVLNDLGAVAEHGSHDHSHSHQGHDTKHPHKHHHEHDHPHGHRQLSAILTIIEKADLNEKVKRMAAATFQRLGEAEAQAHNIDIEAVHFHEVGALDSMVDIIGVCYLFDRLGLGGMAFNEFHFGCGTVNAAHGTLPLPVPAVARLTEGYRVKTTSISGELVTPTAAALLTVLGEQVDQVTGKLVKNLFVSGSRHYPGTPGFVRASLLEIEGSAQVTQQYLIEVNLDDISSERVAYAMERALEAGARDAWTEQILMKKGRPAVKICLLADDELRVRLEEHLLSDTRSWGLRTTVVQKRELAREEKKIKTPYGEARLKTGLLPDGSRRRKWEWDDIVSLAKRNELSIDRMLFHLNESLPPEE